MKNYTHSGKKMFANYTKTRQIDIYRMGEYTVNMISIKPITLFGEMETTYIINMVKTHPLIQTLCTKPQITDFNHTYDLLGT